MERSKPRARPKVEQPRCPYCHESVVPEAEQLACNSCRAWHHRECWREGEGCSACRSSATGLAASEAKNPLFLRSYALLLSTAFVLGMIASSALTYAIDGWRYALHLSIPGGALAMWLAIWALCRATGMSLAELRRAVEGPPAGERQADSKDEGG